MFDVLSFCLREQPQLLQDPFWPGERDDWCCWPWLASLRRCGRFSAAPRLGATTAYLFLTSGRLGQTIKVAVLRWLRALSGDLERLKDIFESDDCSIFIQRPGVEAANLPDVLKHWTLREYVELAFLRAAKGSSRLRRSLQAVLLCMEGRELTKAFDFAFGPMDEYLDD